MKLYIGNFLKPTKNFLKPERGCVYSADGISPCVNCMGGGNREIKVLVYEEINESSTTKGSV